MHIPTLQRKTVEQLMASVELMKSQLNTVPYVINQMCELREGILVVKVYFRRLQGEAQIYSTAQIMPRGYDRTMLQFLKLGLSTGISKNYFDGELFIPGKPPDGTFFTVEFDLRAFWVKLPEYSLRQLDRSMSEEKN